MMGGRRRAEVGCSYIPGDQPYLNEEWAEDPWLFSQFSKKGPFCVMCLRGLNHNPLFVSSVGAGGAAGSGPRRLGSLQGWDLDVLAPLKGPDHKRELDWAL